MVRNGEIVLKNNGKLFKGQAIQSFIETNTYYYHYVYLSMSGVTSTNPVRMYFAKPNTLMKYNYTSNLTNYSQNIDGTNEGSFKKFYFSNNLESISYIKFFNPHSSSYWYRGDMFKFMSQFPNLKKIDFGNSQFNTSLNYSTFPSKIESLTLYDSTVTGNVNTTTNLNNLNEIYLTSCPLTGNFTNVNFSNLKTTYLNGLTTLRGNVNTLINNNANLDYLYLQNVPLFSGDSTTLNVSKLKYINLQVYNSSGFVGNLDNWVFNTGLTYFYLYNTYLKGDISNWDFSNTKCTNINIYNNGIFNYPKGNLTNWRLPTTVQTFSVQNLSGVTAMPNNYSGNTNLINIYYSQCYSITSISGTTFPNTAFNINTGYCSKLADDINTINFPSSTNQINMHYCSLKGNIGNWIMPTGTTQVQFLGNKITGYFSGITFNNRIQYLSIGSNAGILGGISNMNIPNSLHNLDLSNTKMFINFNHGTFNTKNLQTLNLSNLSGITGNLGNLILTGNSMYYLYMNNTNVNADLSKLNISKPYYLYAYNCGNIYGNLTNWITGTTRLNILHIYSNQYLSGDTGTWNANGIGDFRIYSTNLSGALKHNNAYYLYAHYTNISSNIATDFVFSGRTQIIRLNNCPYLTGNLSGVTLYRSFNDFYVHNCPLLKGSNEFINYLFVYRKYFDYQYGVNIAINNIGDSVTGTTESLGDLGTYSGSSTGWDLTENEINNLAAGTDYNGLGSNVPWNSKQKIYWIKNAKVSSTNLIRRYVIYNISY